MGFMGSLSKAVKAPVKAMNKLPGMGAVNKTVGKAPGMSSMQGAMGMRPQSGGGGLQNKMQSIAQSRPQAQSPQIQSPQPMPQMGGMIGKIAQRLPQQGMQNLAQSGSQMGSMSGIPSGNQMARPVGPPREMPSMDQYRQQGTAAGHDMSWMDSPEQMSQMKGGLGPSPEQQDAMMNAGAEQRAMKMRQLAMQNQGPVRPPTMW